MVGMVEMVVSGGREDPAETMSLTAGTKPVDAR